MKQYKQLEKRINRITPPPRKEDVTYVAYWGNDPAIEGMDKSEFIACWGDD